MEAADPGGNAQRAPQLCSRCGTVLSPELEGLCPGCLLDTALGPPSPFPEDHFGDYALIQELAQGGMGVVYRARQNSLERLVALKMLTRGALASDAETRRIHDEAKIADSLKHPNIVPIYEVGVHEEIAYYTMPLMEGGSLAEQMPRFQGRFREAAQLLETVSRAVHHGHQRGILHRDLKPANVLLDAAGVPYVADFGLAKALDSEARVTQPGSVEGTLSYMALEQAEPGGVPLTVAADVYSLGVILYELLTGRLPFEADRFDALLARLREGRPLAPRAIQPRIPRSLEAICLKCLEKEPARRYGSAAELADDLRRFLDHVPVLAMPAGPLERSWRWCLRHPLGTGLLATLIWALAVAAVGTVQTVREQGEELRHGALETNVFAAPLIAYGVLQNLEKQGSIVEAMGADPRLADALEAGDEKALESFCKEMLERYDPGRGEPGATSQGAPFERVFVEDTSGLTRARWPGPGASEQDFLHKNYAFRDYHQAARRQVPTKSRTAYFSRALVSEAHNRLTFVISVPVYSKDGTWRGVLAASVTSNSMLGSLPLNEPGASNHTLTLVSLMDRNRGEGLPPSHRYAVFIHGRHKPERVHFLEEKFGKQIEQALLKSQPPEPAPPHPPSFRGGELRGYRDPMSEEPMLAAFAPVGKTHFVVIMQTREQAALAANALLANRITWWSLSFGLGIALVWLVFWAVHSRFLGHMRL